MTPRTAQTSAPVIEHLANRWSPRAFEAGHAFPEGALRGIMEAARWAPSASNTQPWRFILARRGTETFRKVEASLMGFNQAWAGKAAALIVNVAVTTDAEGNPYRWAEYDLGQAVAHLTLQAQAEGYFTHQMGGFEVDVLRESFDLDENLNPVSITAIGEIGDASELPDVLREREEAPRSRVDLDDIILVRD